MGKSDSECRRETCRLALRALVEFWPGSLEGWEFRVDSRVFGVDVRITMLWRREPVADNRWISWTIPGEDLWAWAEGMPGLQASRGAGLKALMQKVHHQMTRMVTNFDYLLDEGQEIPRA